MTEYEESLEVISKLLGQIELMKNCRNCKKFEQGTCTVRNECAFSHKYWEMFEGK